MRIKRIEDRDFAVSLPHREITGLVRRVADRINRDYAGRRPLFLCVLNGAFVFAADLLRMIDLECEVCFVRLSSYRGTRSTGKVSELMGLDTDIEGRHVIVVEDIVDTGLTMTRLMDTLKARHPASVDICTFLLKPGKLKADLDIRYSAVEVPDDFIVGYGLDYNELGRNLKDIYTVTQ